MRSENGTSLEASLVVACFSIGDPLLVGSRLRYGYGSLGASLHKANRKAAPAAPTALFWRPAPASRWPRDRRLLNYASRPGSDVLDLPPSCTRRERNGGKTV